MIEVINLNKSFNNVQVLKNINATFESGKTNLIIGKSGSGKTSRFAILPLLGTSLPSFTE